jgi:AcrR family transcriptional regulator
MAQRTRLTRAQSQARTRALLLDSAARLFARKGYAACSLEEVAEAAGFSIGAVYSNFASKEDLLLAVLEAHMASDTGDLARVLQAEGGVEQRLRRVDAYVQDQADSHHDWCLLNWEFWLHALRDPKLRPRLAAHVAASRAELAAMLERQFTQQGISLPFPADQLALLGTALADGLLLRRFLDPDSVAPGTFGTALSWLLAGAAQNDGNPPPP